MLLQTNVTKWVAHHIAPVKNTPYNSKMNIDLLIKHKTRYWVVNHKGMTNASNDGYGNKVR